MNSCDSCCLGIMAPKAADAAVKAAAKARGKKRALKAIEDAPEEEVDESAPTRVDRNKGPAMLGYMKYNAEHGDPSLQAHYKKCLQANVFILCF